MGKLCSCKGPCTNVVSTADNRRQDIYLVCRECEGYRPTSKDERSVTIYAVCTSCDEKRRKKCGCVARCSNTSKTDDIRFDIYLICNVCRGAPRERAKHPPEGHISAYVYSTCTQCESCATRAKGTGRWVQFFVLICAQLTRFRSRFLELVRSAITGDKQPFSRLRQALQKGK